MIEPTHKPYVAQLSNGMALRTIQDLSQIEAVAKIHAEVHDAATAEMFYKIASKHPAVTGRDMAFITDKEGNAVATLILIPWHLDYGIATINAAELGIVSTLEPYRRQGLNRALMEYYWLRFAERKCTLSIIQGIPNFYRRYGYEYALQPLTGGWRIQPDQIASIIDMKTLFTIRRATLADIPFLKKWFDVSNKNYQLRAQRTVKVWEYLFEPTRATEAMEHDTYIVEQNKNTPVGYFRVAHFHFQEKLLTVDEFSEMCHEANLSVLQFTAKLASARGKEGIRFQLPREAGIVRTLISFSPQKLDPYSWQMRIPDPVPLLRQMKGLLEQRLKNSMYSCLTLKAGIDLYGDRFGIDIRDGKIIAIENRLKATTNIMSLPVNLLVPLIMGGKTLSELHTFYPDAFAHEPWHALTEVLFPKASCYLATQY